MSGIQTNRTNIDLPTEVSQQIIAKTQEASAVMQLATQIGLPGRGLTIPVITSDPEAAWVGETDKKPVSNPGLDTKVMRGYKLAVIVPFSNQFRRDMGALYDAIVARIPGALGQKFDNTVFGGTAAPGSDFDSLGDVVAQSIYPDTQQDVTPDSYRGLVDADTDIAINGGISNGYILSPQAKGIFLAARDEDGRPLFLNSVAEGAIPMILGQRTLISKGAFINGTPKTVGFVGDWTKAMYGIVEGVDIQFSSDASLTLENGKTINLFQQNMFAVRAEIEIGFRADKTVFNKLTATGGVPTL
jgi:HK97 family phage major capsid protein